MFRIARSIARRPFSTGSVTLVLVTAFFAMPVIATEPSRSMLHDHLLVQARLRFEARRLDIAARKTPEAILQRQETLRAKFRAALGELPERTPLNSRIVGTLARGGFRVERVIYESRPRHHVTADLYLPEGKGPFPGVLVPCGHSANGKAAEAYQRACILMARNGLAVLCFDPIGQGERVQALDGEGKPVFRGSTAEHTGSGLGALLVGRSAAGYRVWDGIRSLDYLASRPDIDTDRLGCTGNSGGGTETAYLMALDDRIAAAAPSCYITSLERLFATIGPQDAEQNITGQVAFGLDHADYVTLRAPKPTLICVGTQDFFDIQGSWDTYREAKLLYGRLGHGERVDLFESDEPHGFTKPRREASMRWLRRWLLHKDDTPTEDEFPILTDQELQCTKTGQVLRDEPGEKSVFDLTAERAVELARRRANRPRGDAWSDEVRRLLALRSSAGAARVEEGRSEAMRSLATRGDTRFQVHTLHFETETEIVVPAVLYEPEKPAARSPLVVVLGTEGISRLTENSLLVPLNAAAFAPAEVQRRLNQNDPILPYLKAGRQVLVADLRGQGDTMPAIGANAPFGADLKEAFLSLHLARPLLGQRVGDLLAVLDALGDKTRDGVHLVGIGLAGPIALHAAALDPRITQVTLERATASWEDVTRGPVTHYPLANVVPGALAVYDLPDLAAAIAPRPLMIHAAVDPDGQPVPRDRLETIYAPARAAYHALNAANALVIQQEDKR